MNLQKNDKVQILAGDAAGQVGRVLRVYPDKARVIVEKVNLVKRHRKTRGQGIQSGIIEKEAPVNMSNVALFCDRCGRGVRVKVEGRGKTRTRNCVRCGSAISKG
ncbi:MAG TPA: 50S ribosomal protein L24 [Candidatus Saccharimonadales bacterium]|nr:50S ribosomal protein L24 [Candidatus Saccharimonadales bacterium]